MYIIRDMGELERLLDERCLKEGEVWDTAKGKEWAKEVGGRFGYLRDHDKIVIPASGKWFKEDITIPIEIHGANPAKYTYVVKIKPGDRQKVINTIHYIRENFDSIYEAMLNALLPFVIKWEMTNQSTGERVATITQLHEARYPGTDEKTGTNCFDCLKLNCEYQKDDMVLFSLIFRPDCSVYGFDDGFEIVFRKDHVVDITDGNAGDDIFEFESHKGFPTYFGI